jgi:hypothetical protein
MFSNFFKKNNAVEIFDNIIENRDLLFISYDDKIPSTYRGLIFNISVDYNGKLKVESQKNEIPDPSTIYVKLPIKKPDYEVPTLSYYPHYIEITPEQRYIYLNWLRNIDEPIDTGYVFLYYYGLERHLLVGDFDKAYNQIIRLRNHHKNKSFQNYSEAALIHSCIMRNKIDQLYTLQEKTEITKFSNAQFLLAFNNGMNLGSENLINIFKKHIKLSSKPIKEDYNLLLKMVENALFFKFNQPTFPFANKYDISKIKSTTEIRFCNYTFPKEIQMVEITDFYSYKQLMADVESIFEIAYNDYKKEKALQRKVEKSQLSETEIKINQFKSDIKRYEKLVDEKKINAVEFEILKRYASEMITNLSQEALKILPKLE